MDIARDSVRRDGGSAYGVAAVSRIAGRMPIKPPSRMPAGRDKTSSAGATSSAGESGRAGVAVAKKNAIIPYSNIHRLIASRKTAAGADRRLAFATPHPIATQITEMMNVLCSRSTHKNKSGEISLNHHCVTNLNLRINHVAGNDVARYATQPRAMAAAVRHLLSRRVLTTLALIKSGTS